MSSQPRTRAVAAVVALGALLGGCSDIYWDRRENVSLGGNDAVESNKVVQMVDPWPRYSANRNIAFNGERQTSAVDRYRHDRVQTPVNITSASTAYQKAAQDGAAASQATSQSALPPAAPVKGP
jgi:hypothetical protein